MLIIRPEQMEAFAQNALRRFEQDMLVHLRHFAPKHAEGIGEPGLRHIIRLGIERAQQYGFTNRGPVRFYLEMMFLFGSDFDTDPQLPWVHAILTDSQLADQTIRADCLYEKAMDYVDTVIGPAYEYEKEAIRRALGIPYADLSITSGDFSQEILWRLQMLYPQKSQYVGEAALRALIARGLEVAQHEALTTNAGATLMIGLLFSFGHGAASDPQFLWLRSTLDQTAPQTPETRVERLHAKVMIYLRLGLAYLDQR